MVVPEIAAGVVPPISGGVNNALVRSVDAIAPQAGAAETEPVPVCTRNCLVAEVLPANKAVVAGEDWYGIDPNAPAAILVAVVALPVSEPTKVVDVTEVNPAKVVLEAPRAILVVPIVTLELTRAVLGIEVKEAPEPLNVGAVTVPVKVGEASGAAPVT